MSKTHHDVLNLIAKAAELFEYFVQVYGSFR